MAAAFNSQVGCLLALKTWMSMGEKISEWTIRCWSPVCFLQEWMEWVCQSVQNRVSSYRVRAKGWGSSPFTTTSLKHTSARVRSGSGSQPRQRVSKHMVSGVRLSRRTAGEPRGNRRTKLSTAASNYLVSANKHRRKSPVSEES